MNKPPDKPLILLVDDMPTNLQVLAAALKADYRIKTATSGSTGIELALSEDRPQLVLLDVVMPGMNGYEVLKTLRGNERSRDIPVIFVTAEASERGELDSLELGADDYLSKPIVVPTLQARVRNILQREAMKREMLRMGLEKSERELSSTQEQLATVRAQLEENAKLEFLGRLVATFSHDIANPIGNSYLAVSGLDDAVKEFHRTFDAGAIRRSDVVQFIETLDMSAGLMRRNLERARDLLQSFKQQALDQATSQRRVILVKAWLDEFLYTLSPMFANTGHRVVANVGESLQFATHPGPLGQVVANLVSNALMHAFEGCSHGTLTISAARSGGDALELCISDDGVGMPTEVLEHAFEPFFTTKSGRGGTGLGLDIVRHLVEQRLRGSLSVKSVVGQGTQFLIKLPLEDE